MKVSVIELGKRPSILTKARMNAPQGSKALGQILESQRWAESAIVALDWQPEELNGLNDAIIRLVVSRYVPERKRFLDITLNLDVNDIFTRDEINRNDLIWVVDSIHDKLKFELQRVGVRD